MGISHILESVKLCASNGEQVMKNGKKTRIGCLVAMVFFLLMVIFSTLYHKYMKKSPALQVEGVSWATAVEKCKKQYESQAPDGQIKAANCRKRTEDEKYFYFSWSPPLAIFVQGGEGKTISMAARCQVDKKSAEIMYMDLGKKVLINKLPRK